jgi:hypothetical protein
MGEPQPGNSQDVPAEVEAQVGIMIEIGAGTEGKYIDLPLLGLALTII